MATINSAQAGNWSTPATWSGGAVPNTGDVVNISHDITYDINDDTKVLGLTTINAGGVLRWAGGAGLKAIRFGAKLVINGGSLIMRDGSQIRIHEGYGLEMNNVAGSVLDCKGSVPNFETYLTAQPAIGSNYLTVNDASGFAAGDIINVYDYTNMRFDKRTDEGFIVTAISGNNVYVRRFVSPSLTLASDVSIGSNIFVFTTDPASVYPGQEIIFQDKCFTVATVNSSTKTVTTVENAGSLLSTGSVFRISGTERVHNINDRVYKMCTTAYAAISASATTVDVGKATGWAAGDEIIFSGVTYANIEHRTIQSISVGGGTGGCDRITLTVGVTYSHPLGSIVTKVNRDCVFIGTSDNTIRSNAAYIYIVAGNTTRTVRTENMEIRYVGAADTSGLYAGFMNRNYCSSPYTNIHLNCVNRHAYKSSINGFWGQYSYSYQVQKNQVSYDVQYGCGTYSGGSYNYNSGCIIIRTYVAFMNYGGYSIAIDYNIIEGCSGYGLYMIYGPYGYMTDAPSGERTGEVIYNKFNYVATVLLSYYQNGYGYATSDLEINNTLTRLVYNDAYSSGAVYHNVLTDTTWLALNNDNTQAYIGPSSIGCTSGIIIFNNKDYIRGNKSIHYRYAYAESDYINKIGRKYSLKFTPRNNGISFVAGLFAVVRGEYGAKLKVSGYVMKNSTFNGTGPFIRFCTEKNTEVARVDCTLVDQWVRLSLEYTFTDQRNIIIQLGAYGSAGNFWIDLPTINAGGCSMALGMFGELWLQDTSDPYSSSSGIRLSNNVRIQ